MASPEFLAKIQECKKDFELETDELGRAMDFYPFKKVGGLPIMPHYGSSIKKNPQMRAFWAATIAFMLAFIGWFAFAPLLPVVRVDIGICDNQDEVDAVEESKKVKKCKCKKKCKGKIGNANIAGVSFDIFTRFTMGSVIERLGPKHSDMLLLAWGATTTTFATLVTDDTGLVIARFFVSVLGSTFVVNQFWNSIMFNKRCVGTANATAGGWGNLGGGLTQLLMPAWYRAFQSAGCSLRLSWQLAIMFPVVCFICCIVWIQFTAQDSVTGKWNVQEVGKKKHAGLKCYMECLADYRVVIMIFQYSASFGQELVFNAVLVSHFHDFFGVDLVPAGAIALSFGGMNLFARSLGGIASDWANAKKAMQGRLWMHFIAHFGQAVFLFLFGLMSPSVGGVGGAIFCLVTLSIFMNMAEGTCYAIVPYMIPTQLPLVSAMVGAGGTLGAVICTWAFYKQTEDDLLPFKLHGVYCMFWTLTIFFFRWDHLGSMFSMPAESKEEEEKRAQIAEEAYAAEEA